ncbi:hypothetical protein PR048_019409 [Dryococelus australis]|uniref:Uncharacterized protein n=1 Tax=Dryococelus australis TaxID=614101 RepID=A0ABQ9H3E6_9NEOP|nr:hypothetical protein PR048_019409 [Dryococelus australis]
MWSRLKEGLHNAGCQIAVTAVASNTDAAITVGQVEAGLPTQWHVCYQSCSQLTASNRRRRHVHIRCGAPELSQHSGRGCMVRYGHGTIRRSSRAVVTLRGPVPARRCARPSFILWFRRRITVVAACPVRAEMSLYDKPVSRRPIILPPISTLASHQGEPGSIPGLVTGLSQVEIVPDDAGPSRGSPVFPTPSFRCHSIFTSITLIGFQDLVVKSRPNFFAHSQFMRQVVVNLRNVMPVKLVALARLVASGVRMERERAGETLDPRENPPTDGSRRVFSLHRCQAAPFFTELRMIEDIISERTCRSFEDKRKLVCLDNEIGNWEINRVGREWLAVIPCRASSQNLLAGEKFFLTFIRDLLESRSYRIGLVGRGSTPTSHVWDAYLPVLECPTFAMGPLFTWHAPGNSAPTNDHFTMVCSDNVRITQKGNDFTSKQQPVEKRR